MIRDIITLQFIPCHRKRERSLIIGNFHFPLCYRCMFILIGYFFVPFLFWLEANIPLYIGILLNLPMIIDGVTQAKKLRTSNNFLRSTTGLMAGLGQAIIIKSSVLFLGHLLITL
ncbi:DUF2085 domain-containing protein [Bacillus oleivorans]|uniref:DUF2085 domain-containing protein n=1 Tax=Bacillus oleivorans TaxID=1448271 RepID=UPI000BE3C208